MEWLSPAFRERVAWASASGVMVTLYMIGQDLKEGKLTWPGFLLRCFTFPLLAYLSAAIAGRLGFVGETNGLVAIPVFLLGRNTLEHLARGLAYRWAGIPPPVTHVFAEPNTTTHVPHSAPDVEVTNVGRTTPMTPGEIGIQVFKDAPLLPTTPGMKRLLDRIEDGDEA